MRTIIFTLTLIGLIFSPSLAFTQGVQDSDLCTTVLSIKSGLEMSGVQMQEFRLLGKEEADTLLAATEYNAGNGPHTAVGVMLTADTEYTFIAVLRDNCVIASASMGTGALMELVATYERGI